MCVCCKQGKLCQQWGILEVWCFEKFQMAPHKSHIYSLASLSWQAACIKPKSALYYVQLSTVQSENSGRGDSFLCFNEWERSDSDGEGFRWETALPYSSPALASQWSSPSSFSGLSYSQKHNQPSKYGWKLTNKNTQNQFEVKTDQFTEKFMLVSSKFIL